MWLSDTTQGYKGHWFDIKPQNSSRSCVLVVRKGVIGYSWFLKGYSSTSVHVWKAESKVGQKSHETQDEKPNFCFVQECLSRERGKTCSDLQMCWDLRISTKMLPSSLQNKSQNIFSHLPSCVKFDSSISSISDLFRSFSVSSVDQGNN